MSNRAVFIDKNRRKVDCLQCQEKYQFKGVDEGKRVYRSCKKCEKKSWVLYHSVFDFLKIFYRFENLKI